jgi:predicted ATPase/class 3 adenylate cyclase
MTLPTGTVTFLRTDVEGSMGHARALGPRWDELNAAHLELIRDAVVDRGGAVVRTEGDALFATFPEAGKAVTAAVAAQRALSDHAWPDDARLRVRMGLHTGEAHLAGDDYGGIEVSRAARVAAVGHGGQIVLSGPTYQLTMDDLPAGVAARALGVFVLKDVPRPEHLYQLDVAGLATEFPPVRAGRAAVGNLDPRLTTFVGRERELGELRSLLAAGRFVTLTGAGGMGKSSLAVEVARLIEADFRDGAWFVPLASIESADAVQPLIARTIGLYDGAVRSASDALTDYVSHRSMLLILDNFEHVMDAAPVVASLVRTSPDSRVVVTSRAPLHLTGEQEYPVAPLVGGRDSGPGIAAGGDGDAARQLFVERARAVRPGWDPGPETAIVDEVCRLVDGLPLGIELAAARVALLPLTAIRDRLVDRLPLPGAASRDAPERQRTLEATVGWSHDLLLPPVQRLLHRLSVFEGSFDIDQARPVASAPTDWPTPTVDVMDGLAELADQSLVERDPSTAGIRFRLLETIRSFAATRLAQDGDEGDVRRRHADAYLALATEAKQYEATWERARWIDRLAVDEPNLRAAVLWAIESGEASLAQRLVYALWRFWQCDGHLVEGKALTERVLAMPNGQGRTVERMWAVAAAGNIVYWQADPKQASAYYEAQLELAKAVSDEAGVADAVFNLGHVAFMGDDDVEASRAHLEDVRRRYRDLGDDRGVARAEWGEANVMLTIGNLDEAIPMLEASMDRFAELGDAQYHAMSSGSLAWAHFMRGDQNEAVRWAVRSLRETYDQRDLGTTAISLQVTVLLAIITGHPDEAARLTGAYDAASERYGVRPPAALERFIKIQSPFKMARDALSPERFEAEYETGRRMSLGQAVDLVTELAASAG